MAIEQIICLIAKCDTCGDLFDDGNFQIFLDELSLREKLGDSEHTNENGQLLCFGCITDYENEDSIKDLKAKPLEAIQALIFIKNGLDSMQKTNEGEHILNGEYVKLILRTLEKLKNNEV